MTPPEPKTEIIPVGAHRQRLIENIGRDSWIYNGVPERGMARHTLNGVSRVLEVYYLKWDKIPSDVQAQMVSSRAIVHGGTFAVIDTNNRFIKAP